MLVLMQINQSVLMRHILFSVCLLLINSYTAAQSNVIKPLGVGDVIPDELWDMSLRIVNHPQETETIVLNDFKGKLIILDFWGTFCGSCIAAMPGIAEIQQRHVDNMVVIPVSWSKP